RGGGGMWPCNGVCLASSARTDTTATRYQPGGAPSFRARPAPVKSLYFPCASMPPRASSLQVLPLLASGRKITTPSVSRLPASITCPLTGTMGLPSVPAPQPASVSTKAQPQHTLAPRMQPFLPRQDTPPARSKLTYDFAAVHRAEGPVGDDADRIPEEANVSVA